MDEPGAGSRGPYRKGVETRARIVEAAIEIFGRHGYRGGTLQLVAKATGVTPSAIVRLFGSKEDLLIAVLEVWEERVRATLGTDVHGLAFLRSLTGIMALHVETRGFLDLHITLTAEGGDPGHPAHRHMVERYARVRGIVADELRRAAADGEIDPLDPEQAALEARSLVAVMDGLELQWLLDPSVDLQQSFVFHMDRLLHRLGAEAIPVGGELGSHA